MRFNHSLGIALVAAACTSADQGATAKRFTILERPGQFGFNLARDGRLAFSKFVDGKAAIYVADADGGHAKRVSFGVWDSNPIWSPDGKWIAFRRDAGGSVETVIVPADSGAERAVASSPADEVPQNWLPNSIGLVFLRSNDRGTQAWEYTLADGSAKRITAPDGSIAAAFASNDGRRVAYILTKDGKSTLWLWSRDDGKSRQLTTDGYETLSWAPFSPDDRWIAYTTRRSGTLDVWRVDVASGEQKQLTSDVADDRVPVWSSDGTRIGFTSNRGGQSDIWVLSKGEEDVQRITDDPTFEDTGFEWTRDGKSIVSGITPEFPHLYRLPIDGGPAEQLTSDDVGTVNVVLSQDGTQVVYESIKNGDADVWMRPATGGEAHLVSGTPGYDGLPNPSPDNSQVAFVSNRGGTPDIWIVPASGGTATQLIDWPSTELRPRWSPDGKTIAFLSDKGAVGSNLWIMPATGGKARLIKTSANVGADYQWSFDSRSIVYTAQDAGSSGRQTFTVAVNGGSEKRLATKTSFNPTWSHSGHSIGVIECESGYCGLFIRSTDGKLQHSLTQPGPFYEGDFFWSHNDSLVAVYYQDLVKTGAFWIDVRRSTGGESRHLAQPAGFGGAPVGFLSGDMAVLAIAGPNGNLLQRIPVPAPGETRR